MSRSIHKGFAHQTGRQELVQFGIDVSDMEQLAKDLEQIPKEIRDGEITKILYGAALPLEKAAKSLAPRHKSIYEYTNKDGKTVEQRKLRIVKYRARRKRNSGYAGRMKGVKKGQGRIDDFYSSGNLAASIKRFKGKRTKNPAVFIGPRVGKDPDGWYGHFVINGVLNGSKHIAPNDFLARAVRTAGPGIAAAASRRIARYYTDAIRNAFGKGKKMKSVKMKFHRITSY